MKTSLSLIILLSFLIPACSSKDERKLEFGNIQIGMAKSEVMEVAGPPHWSDRYDGYDRWTYYLSPVRKQQERVVYFRQGVVVQKGLKEKPLLSAEEMEEIKKPRITTKSFKRTYSDDQLKTIIKKEIQIDSKKKKNKKKKSSLEKI